MPNPITESYAPQTLYVRCFKRILDIVCSALFLVLLCWVYAIVAILVRVKLGSPVIFKQQRPGKINPRTGQEKIFTIYKFRTMTDACDAQGELLPDEIRLTKFGQFLRSTSLDEFPEVWNIFKGDMSIIGPRPLLVRYLDRYSIEQRHRHDVRPGLTGYSQVHGRNTVTWEDKFAMDVHYVKNLSFSLDVKTFFQTITKVFKREGISSETSATMEEFMGTQNSAENALVNVQISAENTSSKATQNRVVQ